MKVVGYALGVARSNLSVQMHNEPCSRSPYDRADEAVLILIRCVTDVWPHLNYLRVTAILNQMRCATDETVLNHTHNCRDDQAPRAAA